MIEKALVYCENEFGKVDGKVANGLVRYSEKYEIVAVIDSTKAGLDAGECLDGIKKGIPIFQSIDDTLNNLGYIPKYFIYGIAPFAPFLDKEQRQIIITAIEKGMNIINGLSEFFTDDKEFMQKASECKVKIFDFRKAPQRRDLHLFTGDIFENKTPVIVIAGTDCAVGKMTTARILVETLKKENINAVFIATGQVGLLQGAKYGMALDVLTSGFTTGEVEKAILDAVNAEHPDIIIVEGQGGLSHPAFNSSIAIIKGANPDVIIIQHPPRRKNRCDFPKIPMPSLEYEIELNELLSKSKVIAITINNEDMTDTELEETIIEYEKKYKLPTTDVLKYGCDKIIKKICEVFPEILNTIDTKTPRIEINLERIAHNAKTLKELYAAKGIDVIGVTKVVCGDTNIAKILLKSGINILADSRITNITKMRDAGIQAQFLLLRSLHSQAKEIIKYADISLNSELSVIKELSKFAVKENTIHKIILMVELGDLREGIMPSNLENIVKKVIKLKGIKLVGLGANLACFGGVKPDDKKMAYLSSIAEDMEDKFKLQLRFISGGNSANYNWFMRTKDIGKINNLRLGESIFLGCETLGRTPIPRLFTDAFTLIAEVIESKIKPSLPYGDIHQDAFGNTPKFHDIGKIRRVLLGVGLQDVLLSGLIPISDIDILGASSDHLIVKAKQTDIKVGETIEFNLNYGALLAAMTSPYIIKTYK